VVTHSDILGNLNFLSVSPNATFLKLFIKVVFLPVFLPHPFVRLGIIQIGDILNLSQFLDFIRSYRVLLEDCRTEWRRFCYFCSLSSFKIKYSSGLNVVIVVWNAKLFLKFWFLWLVRVPLLHLSRIFRFFTIHEDRVVLLLHILDSVCEWIALECASFAKYWPFLLRWDTWCFFHSDRGLTWKGLPSLHNTVVLFDWLEGH